ncbi:MAG: hypothetical protein KA482_09610 [Sphingobium sp.]|nr:hypothetical protein [Sphingobium sp.]MBP8671867.1 hypothetical protein [Sphingobium sp.]MBP9158887.1 hypothetical protein [Sphingobium sp.]
MIFDSHAHLVSDDVVTYPPSPLTGKLTPGEYDDPMTAGKLLDAMDGAGVGSACAVQRVCRAVTKPATGTPAIC